MCIHSVFVISANKVLESLKGFEKGMSEHSKGKLGWSGDSGSDSKEVKDDTEKPGENKKESMFPCLMIMLGSACAFVKVSLNTQR